MREGDKKRSPLKIKQLKHSGKDEKKRGNPHPVKEVKVLSAKEGKSKGLLSRNDLSANTDPSDVYEEIVVHYLDDMDKFEESILDAKDRSEEAVVDPKDRNEKVITDFKVSVMVAKDNGEERDDHSSDGRKEGDSDCEAAKELVTPKKERRNAHKHKVEQTSIPKNLTKRFSAESGPPAGRARNDPHGTHALHLKASPKKFQKGNSKRQDINFKNMKVHAKPPSESSEGSEDKPYEVIKEMDIMEEAPTLCQNFESDDKKADTEENGLDEEKMNAKEKIDAMERRIEKLEEELREIAALEIFLYSVVAEHGSSAHKVHTPARRLSRIYIHACKHWTQDKRASIARNTVSGLVLVAKSCGSDVARLTFWWSNTIILRKIISEAFGSSLQLSMNGRVIDSNGGGIGSKGKSSLKCIAKSSNKQQKSACIMQNVSDWQETSTFTAALEMIESWIFSRIIELVWWQTLTPHMQSPVKDMYTEKSSGRLSGSGLGDQQQRIFSVNLWKSAFQDMFRRLCPVRSGEQECGCLPELAKMVMEQCVARLDIAMFNAILRESAYELPTDPVSDPIIDSKVLPIPAGELSFGSGAQLKNSVGNWLGFLADLFGTDADKSRGRINNNEDEDRRAGKGESKCFCLLNTLSDLLMLPKDLLLDRSIRKEVCPALGLSIITRILCNFTPDEFFPDPVPGDVLEALNSESMLERRQSSEGLISSFPCIAGPVFYCPPSPADVGENVGDAEVGEWLWRNDSIVDMKGFTSDEELDELDSPLTFVIENASSPCMNGEKGHKNKTLHNGKSVRYELLREVWSA